ncbi:30S ribosomal protein S5 [Candidatus Woesearchaeota archaeon CG10_big_fil_rev_8_21_14_0_10_36_11]|nr:MAG: 30S ribosomal protein S5 [Candidatus Woesearchaeota archaeon CG10_big_fil_rev_8_21_14_0_10_36_11]
MSEQRKHQRNQRNQRHIEDVPEPKAEWNPTTALGKMVKEGTITDINEIFDRSLPILESEIVDHLMPGLEEDLLLIGQAKGKFGGGQRRIFRQTQKKTCEGNKIHFMTCAVVGNRNGFIGVATGKSKETVPARDKAKRKARLSLMRIRRGCGSWETDMRDANSIPFSVEGKCGSVRITLMPAPQGKGLCIEKECAKILEMAGIKDIWSKTKGQTKTKLNLIKALLDALRKLSEVKITAEDVAKLGIVEGMIKHTGSIEPVEPAELIVEAIDSVEFVEPETSGTDSGEQEK